MELNILEETKDSIKIEIQEASHTLVNLLRRELWNNKDTTFASYNLKHPLVSHPVLNLKSKKPRKNIQETIDSLKKQTKELRDKIKKL